MQKGEMRYFLVEAGDHRSLLLIAMTGYCSFIIFIFAYNL